MEKIVKTFETQRGAERWARSFDFARQYNRMPVLLVVKDEVDGHVWWDVVNPDVDAHAKPPRKASE